jgi:hypothetical protein
MHFAFWKKPLLKRRSLVLELSAMVRLYLLIIHFISTGAKLVVLKAACDATTNFQDKFETINYSAPHKYLDRNPRITSCERYHIIYQGCDHAPYRPKLLEIYGMRPLTFFPDQGTGDGAGFQLIDYPIPTEPGVTEWTHQMTNPPPVYPVTYRRAVSYFDATDL